MILGRGQSQTDEAIIVEYQAFLDKYGDEFVEATRQRYKNAPGQMQQRLGKSPSQWSEEDILSLYAEPKTDIRVRFCAFLAFLFFRGYHRISFRLIVDYPGDFCRNHKKALRPYRQKLEQLHDELGYQPCKVGSELNLLVSLLLMSQKTLDELTRTDFDLFRDQYQTWYRDTKHRIDGSSDSKLARLENYLVHWGVIPRNQVVYRHEKRLARLALGPIRSAVLNYLDWCESRDTPSTIVSRRNALLYFYLWLQESYPECNRLDDVTRVVALAYVKYLKVRRDKGECSLSYGNDLYRFMRLFFEFVIQEQLDTSPNRNPFGPKDMPTEPNRIRRYLADHEVRKVLDYCQTGASLKKRTVITTLLHTGIRAAELAALKASDVVEIQGKWKLHIHEGKGLKDRLIPLTPQCLAVLHLWQEQGWERLNDHLFTRFGRLWHGFNVGVMIHELGEKLGLHGLSPHRFRHTFAVALLNYGMRETALQKIMGHTTLNMTLEYARILDQTVERAFSAAVEQMQEGPLHWVPSFLATEDYTSLAEADTLGWIHLPLGYCRRNLKLHCESDVKCLLCERFVASPEDLPKLKSIYERFHVLGMQVKADVVASQICRLEASKRVDSIDIQEAIYLGGEAASSQVRASIIQL